MNTLYKVTLLLAFGLLTQVAVAQAGRNNPQLRERLTQAKLTMIQNSLNLSEAKMKELAPIYRRYEAEINELNYSNQRSLMRTNIDSLSAEEADKRITAQLDNAVKISTIRRKYYQELKAVLTPQQVIQLYKSEAQMRRRVMQELRRRMNNRGVE